MPIKRVLIKPQSTGTSTALVMINDGLLFPLPKGTKRLLAAIPLVIERYLTNGEEITIRYEMRDGPLVFTEFFSNPLKPIPVDGKYIWTRQSISYIDYPIKEDFVTIGIYAQNVEPYTSAPKAGLILFLEMLP